MRQHLKKFVNMNAGMMFLFLLLMSIPQACEKIIEIPVGKDNRLYVECFPSNDTDTTFIQVSGTAALDKNAVELDLKDLSVEMKIAGRPCALAVRSIEGHKAVLYTLERADIGDEVVITASADGYSPVRAESVVPPAPEFELYREPVGTGYRLVFDTSASGGKKRYYGVRIHGKKYYGTEFLSPDDPAYSMKVETLDVTMYCNTSVESAKDDAVNVKRVITVPINGSDMVIFEDDGGESGRFEAKIRTNYIGDREEFFDGVVYMRRCRYKLEVFSISETAYRFLNPQINYSLLGAGLIPPFVPSGNASGGYGILGCMGKCSTDWMQNVQQNY